MGERIRDLLSHFFLGLAFYDVLDMDQNIHIEEDWDNECLNHPTDLTSVSD